MKKIKIEIDKDTYNALVAFTVLNDTESFDLCLAEIMRYATIIGKAKYGDLGKTSQKLADKKRKQYASIDVETEE